MVSSCDCQDLLQDDGWVGWGVLVSLSPVFEKTSICGCYSVGRLVSAWSEALLQIPISGLQYRFQMSKRCMASNYRYCSCLTHTLYQQSSLRNREMPSLYAYQYTIPESGKVSVLIAGMLLTGSCTVQTLAFVYSFFYSFLIHLEYSPL